MQTDRRAFNCNKEKIREAVNNLKPNQYVKLRRLTPAESLSLMGIDDEDIQKMLHSGNTDKELYKQSGNSIVVDVLYHLFRKMFIDRDPDVGTTHSIEI